jgi:hypothetical protein
MSDAPYITAPKQKATKTGAGGQKTCGRDYCFLYRETNRCTGERYAGGEVERGPQELVTHHHPHTPRRWLARVEAANHTVHEQVVVRRLLQAQRDERGPLRAGAGFNDEQGVDEG